MFFNLGNLGNFSNCSDLLAALFQYISTNTSASAGSCPNS